MASRPPLWYARGLPYRLGWAYLTGAGSIATGLALVFWVWPRLAATLESGMMGVITLLVWGGKVLTAPTERVPWTGFCISSAFAIGCWVVAGSYRGAPWLAVGKAAKAAPKWP